MRQFFGCNFGKNGHLQKWPGGTEFSFFSKIQKDPDFILKSPQNKMGAFGIRPKKPISSPP